MRTYYCSKCRTTISSPSPEVKCPKCGTVMKMTEEQKKYEYSDGLSTLVIGLVISASIIIYTITTNPFNITAYIIGLIIGIPTFVIGMKKIRKFKKTDKSNYGSSNNKNKKIGIIVIILLLGVFFTKEIRKGIVSGDKSTNNNEVNVRDTIKTENPIVRVEIIYKKEITRNDWDHRYYPKVSFKLLDRIDSLYVTDEGFKIYDKGTWGTISFNKKNLIGERLEYNDEKTLDTWFGGEFDGELEGWFEFNIGSEHNYKSIGGYRYSIKVNSGLKKKFIH